MKKLLYVFDDINYLSGARKVTEYQIKLLSEEYDISIFSLSKPGLGIRQSLPMVKFMGDIVWNNTEMLALSLIEVLKSKKFTLGQKLRRIKYSLYMRLNIKSDIIEKILNRNIVHEFNNFDIICVISESSKLRRVVSDIKNPKKIQWIHTDYELWSEYSDWTKRITANDEEIYIKFDTIVVLSEKSRQGFIRKLPSLENKVVVIPNLIPTNEILNKSNEPLEVILDDNIFNIITVGRIDKEKAYERIIEICRKIKMDDFKFCWYIIGDGPMFKMIETLIEKESLSNEVNLLGKLDNPYPIMKHCDLFVLLSDYEGTPVTINESLLLGTPVIATNVGGIAEQLEDGKWGTLLSENEDIYLQFIKYLNDNDYIIKQKVRLEDYFYDNENILNNVKNILEC